MGTDDDAVAYTRQHWADSGRPAAEHFASAAALMRTHQLLVAELDRLLKPYSLSRTAFLLMATLLMSREHTRPLGQLSRQLMVHPTTVTLVIDQLEGRGLVSRTPHPTDRRTVLASLTEEGRQVVSKAGEDLGEAGFGLSGVDESLAKRLAGVLGQVRAAMGEHD